MTLRILLIKPMVCYLQLVRIYVDWVKDPYYDSGFFIPQMCCLKTQNQLISFQYAESESKQKI